MESALIGIVGVVIGIIVNEFIRRKNRIENYAQKTFDKRLEIFEELYQRVAACGTVGQRVIDDRELSPAARSGLVSSEIFKIADWCDLHGMYLKEEVTIHCMTLLMGVEDIQDIEDETQKIERVKDFQAHLRYAKEMIKKESGIEDVNKSFTSMIKAKYSSPIIEYYREQKKSVLKSQKKKAER
ncbi:hypothetical protein HUT29_17750 [Pseudomonas chlororaphis]|uniref:hypothetical protein n=1 Tax=Pseudomonas chlororaphis TaxID=587753 RepID=UPI001B30389D|nr:hypothetical protein [Pseudomonas chlororaphis]QTT83060.1 hypothetical protein HUT29_17750 [Pseudomonas chlororaphis]